MSSRKKQAGGKFAGGRPDFPGRCRLSVLLLIFTLAGAPLFAAPEAGVKDGPDKGAGESSDPSAAAGQEDDLAHVAILNYSDRTGTKDYAWLSNSLPDAINKFMLERFEFRRPNPDKTQTETDKLGKNKQLNPKDVALIAEKTDQDIVIYGYYTYNEKENKMTIYSRVYHHQGQTLIGKSRVDSPVNNQIFVVVDSVAKQIVRDIYKFVAQQEAQQPKTDKPKKDEKPQKISLTKNLGKSAKNHEIGVEFLGQGFYYSLQYRYYFDLFGGRLFTGLGAGFTPRDDFTLIHGHLNLGWEFYGVQLLGGGSYYQGVIDGQDNETVLGATVGLGYTWRPKFAGDTLFIRPTVYALLGPQGQKWGGLTTGARF